MKLATFAAVALIAALAVGTVSPAQAQLMGSNVQITADNGFTSGTGNCLSASKATTINGGGELVGSDWVSTGCVGYYGADVTNGLLTLTVLEGGNYSYSHFNMQLLTGPTILGFSFIGYNGSFFVPGYPMNESNFNPVTSFGSNYVDVLWDTFNDDFNTGQFRFNDQGIGVGTATFSIITTQTDSSVTPEPATVALLAPGLAAMAGMARRRKKKTSAA